MLSLSRFAHQRLPSLAGVVVSIPALLAVGGYALSSKIETHHRQRILLPLRPPNSSLAVAGPPLERTDQLWAHFLKKMKMAIDRHDSTTIAPSPSTLKYSQASRGQSEWTESKAATPGPADLYLEKGGSAINDYARSDVNTLKDSRPLALAETSSPRTWKMQDGSSLLHVQPASVEAVSNATGHSRDVTDHYDAILGLKLATENRENVDASENAPTRQDFFLHDPTLLPEKNRDYVLPDSNATISERGGISENGGENCRSQSSSSFPTDEEAAYYKTSDFVLTINVSHVTTSDGVMGRQQRPGVGLDRFSRMPFAEPSVRNEQVETSSTFVHGRGIHSEGTPTPLSLSRDGTNTILNLFTNFSKSGTGPLEKSTISVLAQERLQLYTDTPFSIKDSNESFFATNASAVVSSVEMPDLQSTVAETASIPNESKGSNNTTLPGTVLTNKTSGVTLSGGVNSPKNSERLGQSTEEGLTRVPPSTKYIRPDEITAILGASDPPAALISSKTTFTPKSGQPSGSVKAAMAGYRLDSGYLLSSQLESEQLILVKVPATPRLNNTEIFEGMQPMQYGEHGVRSSDAYLAATTVYYEYDTIPQESLTSDHSRASRRQSSGRMEPISVDAYSKRQDSTLESGMRHTSELSEISSVVGVLALSKAGSVTSGHWSATKELATTKRTTSRKEPLYSEAVMNLSDTVPAMQRVASDFDNSSFNSKVTKPNLPPDQPVSEQEGNPAEYLVTYGNFCGGDRVHNDSLQNVTTLLSSEINDTRKRANLGVIGVANTANLGVVGEVLSQTTNSFNLTLELDRIAVEFAEYFKRKEREEQDRRPGGKAGYFNRPLNQLAGRDDAVTKIASANYRHSSSSPSDKDEAGMARTTQDNNSGSTRRRNAVSSEQSSDETGPPN